MNDYLTSLISTNYNLAPTLQPRVAALFEPASSGELNAGEREMYETARNETAAPAPRNETRNAPPTPLVVVEREMRSEASPDAHAGSVIPRSAAAAEPAPRVETNVPTPGRAVSEPSRETFTSTSESPRAVIVRPQVKTVVQAAPIEHAPVAPQAPATPPVIRVTIGRVEVRAVQTPAPIPSKKKNEPPKMSLEEYLKGRTR
jgi:hypothetical protein